MLKALNLITIEEFNSALLNVSEKALSWDRLPIGVIRKIMEKPALS